MSSECSDRNQLQQLNAKGFIAATDNKALVSSCSGSQSVFVPTACTTPFRDLLALGLCSYHPGGQAPGDGISAEGHLLSDEQHQVDHLSGSRYLISH